MKKVILMSAAIASLGLLASCSSDDELSAGGDLAKKGYQEIKIGLGVQANVGTRGTGTVGGLEADGNNWAGEKLNIYMFEQNTLKVAQFGTNNTQLEPIYNNAEFLAPTTGNTGYAQAVDHSVKYYPTQNVFDFWGYHADGALNSVPAFEQVDGNDDSTKLVAPFTIDGTQDIMVGKAVPSAADSLLCDNKEGVYFSAYAARRGVQPNIKFEHLLSRLVFNAVAGSKATTDADHGVKITAIRVYSKATGKLIVAYTPEAGIDTVTQQLVPDTTAADVALTLKHRAGDANVALEALPETALTWTDGEAEDPGHATVVPVGEAILAVPAQTYKVEIDLKQNVMTTSAYDDAESTHHDAEFQDKEYTYTSTLKAPNNAAFKAGTSYNVTITIYGLSDIKITTTLTPWADGGSIDINPEDEVFNKNNGTVTPAPATPTYDVQLVEDLGEESVAATYATMGDLEEAGVISAANVGKIYAVGTEGSYQYYKVIAKTSTSTGGSDITPSTPEAGTDGE